MQGNWIATYNGGRKEINLQPNPDKSYTFDFPRGLDKRQTLHFTIPHDAIQNGQLTAYCTTRGTEHPITFTANADHTEYQATLTWIHNQPTITLKQEP